MTLLRLKTFGGLSVAADGTSATGAAQQRKTLALLALLAANRRGISRDKLIAYLWPDSDADHARNTLKQACHALRRDLHPEVLLGAVELRLNPDVITSDIATMEDALERGDLAAAVASYSGPFLDGFYLAGLGEFERWVEETRGAFKRRVSEALESLATGASSGGANPTAVQWWRRLAALDPLNSRTALGLINALANAGDLPGALQSARVHETLVREELGAAPDRAVVELTERLRAEAEAVRVARRAPAVLPSAPAAGTSSDQAGPAADTMRADQRSPEAPWGSRLIRRPLAVGIVLVLGGLLTGAWLLFGAPFRARGAGTATEPQRLVVLPFENLGPADKEYFADGITEEIAARLASIGQFGVTGSTSAHAYKGTRKRIPEIGRELGVDYVLEGSVRWENTADGGARVRVTPQLVRTGDDTHVWAGIYDEPLDEIFRVQTDIANKVVRALDVTLLDQQHRAMEAIPTRNLEAYDYYLRGIDYERRGADDARAAQAAQRMYEKAVELDSTFALAYTKLSRVHTRAYLFYRDRSPERLAMAKRAADRALELEPGLPEAHNALASYYGFGLADYDRANREYAIVEASKPNAVPTGRPVLLVRQGKFREALAVYERALRLDPLSVGMTNQYAQVHDLLREFPRADALYARAMELAPDQSVLYFWKSWLYLRWDGTTRRARAVLQEAQSASVGDDQQVRFIRILVELFDRKHDEAIRQLTSGTPEVIDMQVRFIPRAQLYAQTYGLMGRHQLERVYYDSARRIVASRIEKQSGDARLHGALGIALAGLGRKQEAIQAGERGVALLPISKEAYQGYYRVLDLARIYAMVREDDAAVDRLEYLLSIPGHLTRAWLRVDPTWDPLRSHPRFQKLIAGSP